MPSSIAGLARNLIAGQAVAQQDPMDCVFQVEEFVVSQASGKLHYAGQVLPRIDAPAETAVVIAHIAPEQRRIQRVRLLRHQIAVLRGSQIVQLGPQAGEVGLSRWQAWNANTWVPAW